MYRTKTSTFSDSSYNHLVLTSGFGIENWIGYVGNFNLDSDSFFETLRKSYKRNAALFRLLGKAPGVAYTVTKPVAARAPFDAGIYNLKKTFCTGEGFQSPQPKENGSPTWLKYYLDAARENGMTIPDIAKDSAKY